VECRARDRRWSRWFSDGNTFLLFVEIINQLLWQGDRNRDMQHSRSLFNGLSHLYLNIGCTLGTLELMVTGAKVGIATQTRSTLGVIGQIIEDTGSTFACRIRI